MTPPSLPPALRAALDRKSLGLSRSDAAQRAAVISKTYRGGGGSGAIRSDTDALAYALARMPATYAAVTASLNALCEVRPDFAPASLLDIGAGPGTATWAAAQAFESLSEFSAFDSNPALRTLALDLAADTRLASLRYSHGEASVGLRDAPPSDFAIASYVVGEMNDDQRAALADLAWAKTRDMLLVVEPGTPAGTQRILDLRRRLIAQGAHVIAPCPHDNKCPLIGNTVSREESASHQQVTPDWCHFVQRLPRSRAHKHLKGAELPFEDEKFSYVVLSRTRAPQRFARVLSQPLVTKVAVAAKLCTADGLAIASIARRDKTAYARYRKLGWGDAIFDSEKTRAE
ncbi:MAG: SAM-dependent methyltransferase [Proteobacteria bacterium]|nr:SAM-dependent methyltransferase [Pseudomonadota bacterium]